MRRIASLLLAGALCITSRANAQQTAAPDFRPLEFLVGSCWIGTFPDGKNTDEHCFEWVFDRKFIRDRHVVPGVVPYRGETIYGWDPIAKSLSYWYWNSEGMVIIGRVEFTPDGIVFPSRYATPQGDVELKAVWVRDGADAYRVSQTQLRDGVWKPLWTMRMIRRR